MNNSENADNCGHGKYWFPAKCDGWGWGLPCHWQGWVTFLLFILISSLSPVLAGGSTGGAVLIIILAAIGLTVIAFWKGEPPRWRWGGETERSQSTHSGER